MTIESNWCILKTDNSGIYALMCLRAPSGDEEILITESMILDFLDAQNIIFGISHVAIQALLEHVMYDQFVCVASGIKPLRGLDGYFDYQKDTMDMKKKPLINEDGTADYKNSLSLATINEGELLAVYVPATEGTPGMDIFGNPLPAPGNGKDLIPLRGKGIVSDDKVHYYAQYSGHIVMDGNRISIEKLYRVSGDLDIEVGNIAFEGDVEVMGDVRSGLSIDSKGNIFIHGHVGACKLNATGSITIEKGTQGRDACFITAGEDISCKFIERSVLNAAGNIYADSVLSSKLTAENKIIITSRHGNVISSEIYGMRGVIVKEAGNSAGAPTILRAGLPKEVFFRASEISKQIKEIDDKINAFNVHLATLDDVHKEISAEKKNEIRTQVMRAKIILTSKKNELNDELVILNDKITANTDNSYVDVTDTVFEGVHVYIGAHPFIVSEAVKEVSFINQNEEVIAVPMIKHEI